MAAPLITANHEWVAFTMTRVEQLANDDGRAVYVDTVGDEAESTTVYGCRKCNAPGYSAQAHKECEPDADE